MSTEWTKVQTFAGLLTRPLPLGLVSGLPRLRQLTVLAAAIHANPEGGWAGTDAR